MSLLNSTDTEADDITLKYFETGHTFMSADSFHHGVEQQMKRQPNGNMYDFNDFCDVIKASNNGKVDVLVMNNCDLAKYTDEYSQRQKGKHRPLLADMIEVHFRRGPRELYYKTEYKQAAYKTFDFLKKNFKLTMPATSLRPELRGITKSKKRRHHISFAHSCHLIVIGFGKN